MEEAIVPEHTTRTEARLLVRGQEVQMELVPQREATDPRINALQERKVIPLRDPQDQPIRHQQILADQGLMAVPLVVAAAAAHAQQEQEVEGNYF